MTRSLDLGCGPTPRNLFNADEVFGVDIADIPEANVKRADLVVEPIPYESDSFEFVTAHDFLEHIPPLVYAPTRRNAFIEVMNEVYRVLKMDGTFLSFTPAYPHIELFRDPTHVNFITEQTFPLYFDEANRWGKIYGFNGAFRVIKQEWHGPHLLTVMQKVPVPA